MNCPSVCLFVFFLFASEVSSAFWCEESVARRSRMGDTYAGLGTEFNMCNG